MPEVRRQMHHHAQLAPRPHGQPAFGCWVSGTQCLKCGLGWKPRRAGRPEGELLDAGRDDQRLMPGGGQRGLGALLQQGEVLAVQTGIQGWAGGSCAAFCAGLRRFLLSLFRGPRCAPGWELHESDSLDRWRKGGVGKSLVARFLAQHFIDHGQPLRCFSTPTARTARSCATTATTPPPRRSTRTTASTACSKPLPPTQSSAWWWTWSPDPSRTDALAARGRRARTRGRAGDWASATGT